MTVRFMLLVVSKYAIQILVIVKKCNKILLALKTVTYRQRVFISGHHINNQLLIIETEFKQHDQPNAA